MEFLLISLCLAMLLYSSKELLILVMTILVILAAAAFGYGFITMFVLVGMTFASILWYQDLFLMMWEDYVDIELEDFRGNKRWRQRA